MSSVDSGRLPGLPRVFRDRPQSHNKAVVVASRLMDQRFSVDSKIHLKSAVDQAAQQIRAMIADGRLVQGERLPEIPLSEALGISRNTVRDAIRMLVAAGLITHEVNRGAVVRVLGVDDIRDIYGVRRRLELSAIREIPAAPPDLRTRSHEALEACGKALASGDYSSFVEHELDFHASIVAHLRSERIDDFFSRILAELRLIYSKLASDDASGATHALLDMYRTLYTAAESGRVVKAQDAMRAHIDTYEARMLTAILRDGQTAAEVG